MGMPPPPPPPDIPDLEETADSKDGRRLTTRERMELHRANPTCRTCHQYMDPIGLALDNFDVTGKWRYRENGAPLDTRGDDVRRPRGHDADGPDAIAALASDSAGARVHGEPDGVRRRSPRRGLRPARRSAPSCARPEANGYTMSSFIMGVVNSPAFRSRRADGMAPITATATERRRHQLDHDSHSQKTNAPADVPSRARRHDCAPAPGRDDPGVSLARCRRIGGGR